MKSKSLLNLDENIVSAGAYIGVWVTGILVFIFERENKTVRFHALQSTITFGALSILSFLVNLFIGWIPLVGGLVTFGLGLISVAAWAFLTYMAYKGNMFKIPILGDIVWEQVNK